MTRTDLSGQTVFVVTQHYVPDETSTAWYMTEIAKGLAAVAHVVVLSGTRGSRHRSIGKGDPDVAEVGRFVADKARLARRLLAMLSLGFRSFFALLWRMRRGDVVVVVTTPFMSPYFAVLGARLRGNGAILILYDLYPDVLIASGLTSDGSITARMMRWMNRVLFHAVGRIVTIGRDMELRLARYGVPSEKIRLIPNWATLSVALREVNTDNPFRQPQPERFIVGMGGNLGFTHDPNTVFEAARRLAGDPRVHFLLSGWGVGWTALKRMQDEVRLANVTLVERVPDADLETFLAAADAWIIPYRRNISGLSVPSRFYNLLAIGRPVIALIEPEAEHAQVLLTNDIGWVVPPEDPDALARVITEIASAPGTAAEKGRRAAETVATRYSQDVSIRAYQQAVLDLMADRNHAQRASRT